MNHGFSIIPFFDIEREKDASKISKQKNKETIHSY